MSTKQNHTRPFKTLGGWLFKANKIDLILILNNLFGTTDRIPCPHPTSWAFSLFLKFTVPTGSPFLRLKMMKTRYKYTQNLSRKFLKTIFHVKMRDDTYALGVVSRLVFHSALGVKSWCLFFLALQSDKQIYHMVPIGKYWQLQIWPPRGIHPQRKKGKG